jgi:chromosome segregation ATPase
MVVKPVVEQPKAAETTTAEVEEKSQSDISLESIRSQLTEAEEKNKSLEDKNLKLNVANTALNAKINKMEADNTVFNAQIKAQAGHIRKHDEDMRSMMVSHRESQRDIAQLMERINSLQDKDEQMKPETKRIDTDTPDELSTPETDHLARGKAQRTTEAMPPPVQLFTPTKNKPSSRTLDMISETGKGLHHRNSQQTKASTSYAETSGGSKK